MKIYRLKNAVSTLVDHDDHKNIYIANDLFVCIF